MFYSGAVFCLVANLKVNSYEFLLQLIYSKGWEVEEHFHVLTDRIGLAAKRGDCADFVS